MLLWFIELFRSNFRSAGFHQIAQRVNHSMYEVSDRLTFFLCQRRPDHNNGQHFIIPEVNKIRQAKFTIPF